MLAKIKSIGTASVLQNGLRDKLDSKIKATPLTGVESHIDGRATVFSSNNDGTQKWAKKQI